MSNILSYIEGKQVFTASLIIATDCQESFTTRQMHGWLNSHFEGSDVGVVIVSNVKDQTNRRQAMKTMTMLVTAYMDDEQNHIKRQGISDLLDELLNYDR